MLGIPDASIWSAYVLSIACAILCVVYGLLNWKRGMENDEQQIIEERVWESQEREIEESL